MQVALSTKVSLETAQKLKSVSKETEIPQSKIVEKALLDWFKKNGK